MSTAPTPFAAPLSQALKSIDSRLTRENKASFILATAQRSELQNLPSHVRVTPRQVKGTRVPVRGPRYFRQSRLRIAEWLDGMAELALPTLLCVINGQANIRLADYFLHCQPGDFILVPPGVPRGIRVPELQPKGQEQACEFFIFYPGRLLGEGLECWIVHFDGVGLKSGIEQGISLIKNTLIANVFERLSDELQNNPQPSCDLTFILLRSLLLLLQQEVGEGRAFLPELQRLQQPVKPTHDPIEHALAYIDSHLGTHLTIDVLARQTALSPTSFKKQFSQTTGTTFHRHLTARRVEFAARLLRDSDLKLHEIAQLIGLSANQLGNLFRQQHDCTPGEYRKQHNKV